MRTCVRARARERVRQTRERGSGGEEKNPASSTSGFFHARLRLKRKSVNEQVANLFAPRPDAHVEGAGGDRGGYLASSVLSGTREFSVHLAKGATGAV